MHTVELTEFGMDTLSSEDEDQLLISWLAMIGMLTMYWTPVERHIDQCVHLLHLRSVDRENKKKPTRLGSKLEFIRNNLPAALMDAQELKNLVRQTNLTVKIRDVLVHGVLNAYDQERIEVGKVKGRTDEHLIENFTIDRSRLERSVKALSSLQEQWHSIAWILTERAAKV